MANKKQRRETPSKLARRRRHFISSPLSVIHKGRMYWRIRLSFIYFHFLLRYHSSLCCTCLSLSLPLPDARGRPGRVVLLLACILRDLCNRRRRRRRRSPNDIHTEDASGGDEALPNNCGENAKKCRFVVTNDHEERNFE